MKIGFKKIFMIQQMLDAHVIFTAKSQMYYAEDFLIIAIIFLMGIKTRKKRHEHDFSGRINLWNSTKQHQESTNGIVDSCAECQHSPAENGEKVIEK